MSEISTADMLVNFDLICAVARGNPVVDYNSMDDAARAIRAALLERDALKADVERLEKRCEGCIAVRPERLGQLIDEAGKWRKRAEKAEAETVTLKQEISGNDAAHRLVEAALAEARPLLDAVMGDGTATTSARHPVVIDAWAACVLEFALAYRAAKVSK